MELTGIAIIAVIFVFLFIYIYSRLESTDKDYVKEIKKQDKEKIAEEKKRKLEENRINAIGEKMLEARELLKKSKFHIDEEEISPIEVLGNNQYLKMVCIDTMRKNMAVISIMESAKDPFIKVYNIDNVIKCNLEVNDKEIYDEDNEEVGYELKSIKLCIKRDDIEDKEYIIGLLPKIINNPEMVFRKDYFDFAREVQKHIKKLNKNYLG